MAIDYTQPSKDVLVQKVNRDNGTSLTAGMVDFGSPVSTGITPNTQVVMTARANSGYSGSVSIKYNRRNLQRFEADPVTTFSANSATRVSDLLTAINQQYQINIAPEELVDAPLPVFDPLTPNATLPFVLQAQPSSLMYVGAATLQLRRADIALGAIVTQAVLNDLPADL